MPIDTPKTLLEAVRYFSDIENCEKLMRRLRWPDGRVCCPECQSTNVGEIKTRRLLRCRDCRRQIYTKRGTIFEDSPLGLDKWFVAVWAIANCKNGISSHELARALGVQQKSAWFMLHRIRTAMEIDEGGKFSGPGGDAMTITPTTPASECRDHIAECMGWTCPIAINADPLWEHTSGRCRRTNPIPTGLDILLCLPPGWAWQCRIARWEAYDDNDSHKVVVAPRTTNEPDDAARLVAMAWQEHAKENQ